MFLRESSIGLTLSHHIVGLSSQESPISRNKGFNQVIFDVADASAIYSFSTNDFMTIDCFYEDKEIKSLPKYT